DMVISDTTAHYFKNIITASHQQWWGGKCKSSKPRIIPGASSTIGSRLDGSRKCGGQVRANKFPNTDLQGIESYNINFFQNPRILCHKSLTIRTRICVSGRICITNINGATHRIVGKYCYISTSKGVIAQTQGGYPANICTSPIHIGRENGYRTIGIQLYGNVFAYSHGRFSIIYYYIKAT